MDAVWKLLQHPTALCRHQRAEQLQHGLVTRQFGELLLFLNDRSIFVPDTTEGVEIAWRHGLALENGSIHEPCAIHVMIISLMLHPQDNKLTNFHQTDWWSHRKGQLREAGKHLHTCFVRRKVYPSGPSPLW